MSDAWARIRVAARPPWSAWSCGAAVATGAFQRVARRAQSRSAADERVGCGDENVHAAGRERRAGKTSRCSGGTMHAARHTLAALLLLSRGRYVAQQRAACARGRVMPVVVRGVLCAAFSAPLCTAAGPDLRHLSPCPAWLAAWCSAARSTHVAHCLIRMRRAGLRPRRAPRCILCAHRSTTHCSPATQALMVLVCHNMSRATLYERLRLLPSLALL